MQFIETSFAQMECLKGLYENQQIARLMSYFGISQILSNKSDILIMITN
jgi:hypothetical protein